MNRTVKKIVLALIIIILLPGLFFTAFEINQIKESEQVIEGIYENQLDAMLTSVNQYSLDIATGWKNSLNSILIQKYSNPEGINARIDSFLNINKPISAIFFADSFDAKSISVFNSPRFSANERKPVNPKNFFMDNWALIERLIRYKTGSYYKIEPVNYVPDSSIALIFLLNDPREVKNIGVVLVNPEKFVQEILGPRINAVTQNELTIICTEKNTNKVVVSTDTTYKNQEIVQKKSLWLIPSYELGILPRGVTIEAILEERTNTSIILILVLTSILIAGVFIIFRNIRREVELAQIKSDFVSNVSHELRTPLALITMFADTLEMGRAKTEEKKQEYYSIISKEATRLSRIVNKILSFSKIEAGKRDYHFSNVNLYKIVEDVYNTYKFHLQNSGFKIVLQQEENIPDIKADGEAVSEAVINLIDNAVKYSIKVKEITIFTGVEKNFVFVEIQDKGTGISDENQKKIFDKFYRVSEGLVHTTKGTGLGLTIVKHIVDAHKGEIKVKSKPGEGSSFKLMFPL
ncbi:MAG: HAMP domain-containing sensor histidine kinase [Ignavibacteriaceae bacterium]